MKYYILLISVVFSVSCIINKEKENKTLIVGNGDDVAVTLIVDNKENIERIEFSSNENLVSINKKDVVENDIFIYNFENKGEGTFKVCIYKQDDTICTLSYVEQGYAPKIEFVNDSLIFTDFF